MCRVQSRSRGADQVSAKTARAKARVGRTGGAIAAWPRFTASGSSQVGTHLPAPEPTRRFKSRIGNCEAFAGWRNA
jgi:hypothetical protein